VKGANLIPHARMLARRRAARVKLWSTVVPATASVLMAAYGYLRASWPTETSSLREELGSRESAIKLKQAEMSRLKSDTETVRRLIRANEAVGLQPDWGVLLLLVSARLGDEVVLQSCILDPVNQQDGKAVSASGLRPTSFRLTLGGVGKDQRAIANFVRALDNQDPGGLFDQVSLLECRRMPFAGREAMSFRIECALSDSGAGGETK
jgi:Tfp pilus assembly protein PilN